jgi:hypothetical protein
MTIVMNMATIGVLLRNADMGVTTAASRHSAELIVRARPRMERPMKSRIPVSRSPAATT